MGGSIPKTHRTTTQLFHSAAAPKAGAGFGPGDHPAAPAAGAAPQDVGIAAEGTGVRFPHHYVHQAFAIEAGHGLGDDNEARIFTPETSAR